MRKLQNDRVEQMPTGGYRETTVFLPVSVKSISDDRMSKICGVHAYLMHPPGFNCKLDKREWSAPFERRPPRGGTLPVRRADRHAPRIPRFSSNGSLNCARLGLRCAVQNGKIRLLQPVVRLKCFAEAVVRTSCLGEHHDAARPDIESVHNPRTLPAADVSHSGPVTCEFFRERLLLVAWGGMDDPPRGFVHHDNVAILENHFHMCANIQIERKNRVRLAFRQVWNLRRAASADWQGRDNVEIHSGGAFVFSPPEGQSRNHGAVVSAVFGLG